MGARAGGEGAEEEAWGLAGITDGKDDDVPVSWSACDTAMHVSSSAPCLFDSLSSSAAFPGGSIFPH